MTATDRPPPDANADRLTREVDRLAAELENTQAQSRDARIMLKNVSRIAADLATQAQVLLDSRQHAEQVASAAASAAACSLTENVDAANARLCASLDDGARALASTTASLRGVLVQNRILSGASIAIALASMVLGACGMHWFQKHDAASDQDIYLRTQGMLLNRMAATATKKEALVLNALYRRAAQKVASDATPTSTSTSTPGAAPAP